MAAAAPTPVMFEADETLPFRAVSSGPFNPATDSLEGFKSYLVLAGEAPDVGKDVVVKKLSFEIPRDANPAMAEELHAAIAGLPKPVWIQCATGNRASAALLVHAAKAAGLTPQQALEYGKKKGFKCVEAQPLRDWITQSVNPVSWKELAAENSSGVVFRQLFEPVTSTYTYLVACPKTGEAVLIDSVQEKVDRDVALINQLGLKLLYSIGTHVHADHVTGTAAMRKKLPGLQSVIAEPSAKADVHVKEGDVLKFGERSLKVLSTAGHTDGCISLVLDDESMVFTGDALFVRGCGRTDFQQGHAGQLYDNIHGKLFTLPGSCKVYPGHDYNGHLFSTIAEERRFNPRLTKSREDFIALMAGLNLPPPKFLDVAVPANMLDGEAPPPAAAAGVAGVEVSAGAAAAATAPAGSK